ncbi:cyclopropane-fatty-acyl-phospholipid synthase family protein [uncultured Sulfitobacter sp.]|uniref:SAM-dependent methyltransferase n=1 Tax=uncultured Sulfitobacter sp. TaxID=191468 RepID=UPI00262C3A51|nr:cyclopropane-fatty-acyl-phospholipid synthase family protein [uncultured Sulfitobacter sp.]
MTGFWQHALDRLLRSLVQFGSLRVIMPTGDIHTYGETSDTPVTVRLLDPALLRKLVVNPELVLGESYMDETLVIEDDDVQGLLAIIVRNVRHADAHPVWWQKLTERARAALRGLAQKNPLPRARRNAAHHYDLSAALFDTFLDADRQYSCAYFRSPDVTLDQAQRDKKAHIARKLMIEPGMTVLDIGCGWGGMALTLARDHGARVVGITLSEEQHTFATERARREGLSDRVEFRLCDYRQVEGTFDRIVSVGMFEHVGLRHYNDFFAGIRNLLSPDGIALIHTIGWAGPPKATNPWLKKYIFPGGYIPALSEMMTAVERNHLWPTDMECLRLHYAYTLRHWFDRFRAHEAEVRALYDARFTRMWRFYLAASEQTFRHAPQAVFQIQLSRRVDAVPLTRDYLYDTGPTEHFPRARDARDLQ